MISTSYAQEAVYVGKRGMSSSLTAIFKFKKDFIFIIISRTSSSQRFDERWKNSTILFIYSLHG